MHTTLPLDPSSSPPAPKMPDASPQPDSGSHTPQTTTGPKSRPIATDAAGLSQELNFARGTDNASDFFDKAEPPPQDIADCLGAADNPFKEAILFPIPSNDPDNDCHVRPDMTQQEADQQLVKFFKLLIRNTIPLKPSGGLRLHVLDRNATGGFVVQFPVNLYDKILSFLVVQNIAIPESFPFKVEGTAYIVPKDVMLCEAIVPIFNKLKTSFTIAYSKQYKGMHVIYTHLDGDGFMKATLDPVSINGKAYSPIFSSPAVEMEDYYVYGMNGISSAKFLLESAFTAAGINALTIRRTPSTMQFVVKLSLPFSLPTMDKMQQLCSGGPIEVLNPRRPDLPPYEVWFANNLKQLESKTGQQLARNLEEMNLGLSITAPPPPSLHQTVTPPATPPQPIHPAPSPSSTPPIQGARRMRDVKSLRLVLPPYFFNEQQLSAKPPPRPTAQPVVELPSPPTYSAPIDPATMRFGVVESSKGIHTPLCRRWPNRGLRSPWLSRKVSPVRYFPGRPPGDHKRFDSASPATSAHGDGRLRIILSILSLLVMTCFLSHAARIHALEQAFTHHPAAISWTVGLSPVDITDVPAIENQPGGVYSPVM